MRFGNRTELFYELDGKIKDIRRSGNHQRTLQQYEYNARGQIIGVVDGNQNPISYDVDSWGRITGIGFADGVKEGYEYIEEGNHTINFAYLTHGKDDFMEEVLEMVQKYEIPRAGKTGIEK